MLPAGCPLFPEIDFHHHSTETIPSSSGTGLPCLWVPHTTAWRVLRLGMEGRPPIWRVAANKLNKQSRIADKGWSFSLGLGEALTTLL